jgi:hypothetical protein
MRWQLYMASTEAESGGNAGSNFQILSYADNGAPLATPLKIDRATAKVTLARLNLSGLPTSATGLVAGDVWRNGNVLNIV